MNPVEVVPAPGGTLILRARGSELLILPNHIVALQKLSGAQDFTGYFMHDALINRPARKLFEAWLRKDASLWKRIYHTVHKEIEVDKDVIENINKANADKGHKATESSKAEKENTKSVDTEKEQPKKKAKKAASDAEAVTKKKTKKKAASSEKTAKKKTATKKKTKTTSEKSSPTHKKKTKKKITTDKSSSTTKKKPTGKKKTKKKAAKKS